MEIIDGLFYLGSACAISGVILGFFFLASDKNHSHKIPMGLAIFGIITMIIFGLQIKYIEPETSYQSLKPSLDLKSCPDLERIMSYSSNQTMIDMAKRNYNERCL